MPDPFHEQQAREYLTTQFGPQGFSNPAFVATFEEAPLEGEGPIGVFAFTALREGSPPENCFVVAGQTQPNYYPALNLSAEEMYNLHIGTRFMFVLAVAQLPSDALLGDVQAMAASTLSGVVPGALVQDVHAQAAFRLEDQTHIVARARVGPEEVYLVLGDIPLGISRRIDLPPHVIYRIHLGQVIRLEKSDEEV